VSQVQVRDPADVPAWLARGCRMFTFASDTWMLMGAAKTAVDAFRTMTAAPAP
jgi:2-keto-3-deoxy-L-rhamnonate aldolase RhmA